jgi:hypothetical protein
VLIGLVSLIVLGNLPDVAALVDKLELPGLLFYVAAFGYGYFWSSIGRQTDKGVQLMKNGSYDIT